MNKMHFNLPKFFASQIDKSLCEDVIIDGMDFFRADLKPTIDEMTKLLEKGISIYKY